MRSAAVDSRSDPRTSPRRWQLLLVAHALKSAGWGLALRWDRLKREWQLGRERALIERSRQFDKSWYLTQNPDVAEGRDDPVLHYLQRGAAEGRNPHPLFDSDWYLAQNPDVRDRGANPLVHFLERGAREGRDPSPLFSSAWVLERDPRAAKLGPLGAYLRFARPKPPRQYPKRSAEEDIPKTADFILDYRRAKRPGNRVVVYTGITNNYDTLRVPRVLDPDIDYVCFSDTPRSDLGVFEIRSMPYRYADPARTVRYVKTHPHLLFPDHEIAIWLDATMVITGDLKPLVARLIASGKPFGAVPHPRRHDVYDEAYHCARCRKDDLVVIAAQVARYRRVGLPKGPKIPENNFTIWNLRHAATPSILESWWDEIASGSRRDQISLGYALWRHGEDWAPLFDPKPGKRHYPGLVLRPHVPSDGRAAVVPPGVPARVIDPAAQS